MDLIKLRRDTLANWTSENPILADGEMGIITDDITTIPKIKIGDGTNEFLDLPTIDNDKYTQAEITNLLSGKADKVVIYNNGDSLAIDGANGTWFNATLTADKTFTLTNIVPNIEYIFQCVSNNGVITIILPNTADKFPQPEIALTATGAERLISMIYDGTNRRWFISEEII